MQNASCQSPGILVAPQKRDHFRRESGKSGQPAEKPRDHEQPRLGRKPRVRGKVAHRQTDEIGSNPIGRQGSGWNGREGGVEPESKKPAQPSPKRCPPADGEHLTDQDQRSAAASSLALASTQREPIALCSFFQKGARVLR